MGTFPQIAPGTGKSEQKNAYEVMQLLRFGQAEETTLTRLLCADTVRAEAVRADRDRRCDEILQHSGDGTRKSDLAHTHCTSAVIGISGGLDSSTLALLVTVRAFDLLSISDRQDSLQ